MRRFTRLTNGFSKKIENHIHAIAIHYMHYNFAKMHHASMPTRDGCWRHAFWSIEDIVAPTRLITF